MTKTTTSKPGRYAWQVGFSGVVRHGAPIYRTAGEANSAARRQDGCGSRYGAFTKRIKLDAETYATTKFSA
ncbi:hypothetical protein MKK69_22865 [Methylobacterium sp. J-026]|jgi:hypothetical protein|uniref:hypothetical protein n=1 Tax=unclassified Methylobacterium TaxID=2615210 RepID=UPI0011CC8D5E|nr:MULTISPECIES: hypothetical protein [unclassified Methylobacterium]MCJ2136857.1 hypothetical protein [Methylobacterium sp. J-026]TXM71121.1 hypothetical protein FV229_00115 [Methylobacterium sp. WL120]